MAKRRSGKSGSGDKSADRSKGSESTSPSSASARDSGITVKVALPTGAARGAAMGGPGVAARAAAARKHFGKRRHRLLSMHPVEPTGTAAAAAVGMGQKDELFAYKSIYYDYTNNEAVEIISGPRGTRVSATARQPLPNQEEFDVALNALRKDAEIGSALRDGTLTSYRPMPPVLGEPQPDGSTQRMLTVGLRPTDGTARHEIVAVDMAKGAVRRFDAGAPARSRADAGLCGVPDAGQPTVDRGTPGQYDVVVKQGTTTVWQFHVIRPAASSGTNGSAIELRNVKYRGKLVLKRAHVPILNVRYDNDACGPFRDWQWQEGQFQADGSDVAPGFRECASEPRTVVESGNDTGDFAGVAVFRTADEVVLVSELEAGWYRYISQWRFGMDGTIRPRFEFGAVQNSCVCNKHHHHVYWRLDFDIGTAGDNVVQEFNPRSLTGGGAGRWHTLRFEVRRPKDDTGKRKWRVQNATTHAAYEIRPSTNDGVADEAFGVGDFWALRYRRGEIDDGQDFTTDVALARAHIDKFVQHESIVNTDVVVWYAAHFTHDVAGEEGGGGGHVDHIVGPDLVPTGWRGV